MECILIACFIWDLLVKKTESWFGSIEKYSRIQGGIGLVFGVGDTRKSWDYRPHYEYGKNIPEKKK